MLSSRVSQEIEGRVEPERVATKTFGCFTCDPAVAFDTFRSLWRHLRLHQVEAEAESERSRKGSYYCQRCKKRFGKHSAYKKHLKVRPRQSEARDFQGHS